MKLIVALALSLLAFHAAAQAPAAKVDGISRAHKAERADKAHKAQAQKPAQKLDGLNKDRSAKGFGTKARPDIK
jgi:hypothetical protein